MKRLFKIILAGAVLLAAPFSPAFANAYKAFGKWEVYCTNGLACDMRFYDTEAKAGASAYLKRDAGPDAPASLSVSISGGAFGKDVSDMHVTVAIDGAEIGTYSSDHLSFNEDEVAWTLAGNAAADGLAEKMHAGKVMTVTATGGGKKATANIPLTGVAASLLFMDDIQGRVDHSDALAAKGSKPPSDAPPLKEIRHFADLPEKIRPIFAEAGECSDLNESMLPDIGAFVHRLSDTESFYAVPCGPPGAYNAPFVAFYQSEDYVARLAFPVMMPEGPGAMSNAYNIDYDYKTQTLTSFYKGRGLGDCGSYYKWKLTEGGDGKTLVLMEETDKEDCDGKYDGGPQKWPAVWPPQ